MEIHINKDFTEFKAEKWKGLHGKQLVMGVVFGACFVGQMAALVYVYHVPDMLACILSLPPVAVPMVLVYCRPGGVSFLTYVRRRRGRKNLLYRSIREEQEEVEGEPLGQNLHPLRGVAEEIKGRMKQVVEKLPVGKLRMLKKKGVRTKKEEIKNEKTGSI